MTYVERVIEALHARWVESNGASVTLDRDAVIRRHEQALGHGELACIPAAQVADDFAERLGLQRKGVA